MSYRHLDNLLDIARCGYWVQISCKCGHTRRLDPMRLVVRLGRRGGDLRLNRLGKSLKCGRCGGKSFSATHCQGPEMWSR